MKIRKLLKEWYKPTKRGAKARELLAKEHPWFDYDSELPPGVG